MRLPEKLGPDEERALMERMREGDQAARAALIERNLRTVAQVTWKFRAIGVEAEDRLSIGCLALIYAVDHYDPARGIPLKAYIKMTVKGHMLNANRDGRPDRENVVASLDAPMRTRSGDVSEDSLYKFLPSSERGALDRMVVMELRRAVRGAVAGLPEPMKRVIWLRYGGWRVLSQREVAAILGCGTMTVSRREHEALRQCRAAIRAGGKNRDERGHREALELHESTTADSILPVPR
jgi:RNA polymerase sporulation-specific sigma factor